MKFKPHHYWQIQRLTALFLEITLPILGGLLISMEGTSYNYILIKVHSPVIGGFLGIIILVSLYHIGLESRVIIHDYLRGVKCKIILGFVYWVLTLLMFLTIYSLMGIMGR